MIRTHAVRLTVALVLFGTVVGATSIGPTGSQFSDAKSLEDNNLGAADNWGIELAVDDGGDLQLTENSSNNLEITATLSNEYRYTEAVMVEFETKNKSENQEVILEGGETDSVTFTVDADELGTGEHLYVVTAADKEAEGVVAVIGNDENGNADSSDYNER
ncbi:hypothetical protein [Natrinema sp. HArc-T2]|uniref:hypothetical protein n=1 Tax=Natrinema sp. HArc-T2 TaxID=3242701 RepID=UPI00359DF787